MIPITMPKLGEAVTEGTVIRWLKKVGEAVSVGEVIAEVESEKLSVELESPTAGTLAQILKQENETVPVGEVIALVAEKPSSEQEAKTSPRKILATPTARRAALEHDVDLQQVPLTGPRITKDDVLRYVASREKKTVEKSHEQPTQPKAAVEKPESPPSLGADRLIPISVAQKRVAAHMLASVHTSPHAFAIVRVDCSRVVAFRNHFKNEFEQREGISLTFTTIFIAAVAKALQEVPIINARLEDGDIRLLPEINIGVAVGLADGLLVPVVKHANRLNLKEIQQVITDLALRARTKRLIPDELVGATFTITNFGSDGGLIGLPIIAQPQLAILGVGMIVEEVIVVEANGNKAIGIAPMCYLSLSFDHRALNGTEALEFLRAVKNQIENWQ